jgi:transcriptional regulator with XRE-family HTH domain
MWEQRPPLLPNQFAQRMGVRKQQISLWLNSDATPPAPVLVRLARGMGRPVSEMFIAAGYASKDDPLLDSEESWAHVLMEIQSAPEFLALAEPQQIIVIGVLHAAHTRDSAKRADAAQARTPPEDGHDRGDAIPETSDSDEEPEETPDETDEL